LFIVYSGRGTEGPVFGESQSICYIQSGYYGSEIRLGRGLDPSKS